jgi:hypothetical protein
MPDIGGLSIWEHVVYLAFVEIDLCVKNWVKDPKHFLFPRNGSE